MAQSNGCEQFQVGSSQWTDCVHDQATGGGLMPWIVVIPLGVMVVGMMIGFARQFSGAGRQRAKEHGAAGTAGSWLIFISLIELSIGIGSYVADRRAPGEGGGFSISAVVLLGVGALLFVAGVWAKARGRRRARIYNHGVPGEALVRAVHETGTMVNNQPMYGFDLEVSGTSFPPTTTTHREVVPFWFLNRVGPDMKIPVKVDPSNPSNLIFDWDRLRTQPVAAGAELASSFAGPGGLADDVAAAVSKAVPDAGAFQQAMQAAQQFGGGGPGGSGWHVGKVIGAVVTLFILAVVGGGLYFVSTIFRQVSDATNNATEQVEDAFEEVDGLLDGAGPGGGGPGGSSGTTISVSRAASGRDEVGYSVALPLGWNDATGSVPERQGGILVDVLLKPPPPGGATIIVARSLRYMDKPAPENARIDSIVPEIIEELGPGVKRSPTKLGGQAAVALDVPPSDNGIRARQVVVLRDGQVLFVAVTAPQAQFRTLLPVFEELLDSWAWESVSAR